MRKTGKLLRRNVYSNSDGACLIWWLWGLNDTCFFSSMISSKWKIIAAMLINIIMLQGFGFWFLKREYKKEKCRRPLRVLHVTVHVQRSEDNFSAVSSLISPYFEAGFFFIFLFLLLLLFSSAFQVLGLKVCATTAWLWGRVLLFLWLCCLLELPANSSFSTFTSHSPGYLDYKCTPLSLAFYTDSVNQTQVFRLMRQVLLPALSNLWLLNHFQSLC